MQSLTYQHVIITGLVSSHSRAENILFMRPLARFSYTNGKKLMKPTAWVLHFVEAPRESGLFSANCSCSDYGTYFHSAETPVCVYLITLESGDRVLLKCPVAPSISVERRIRISRLGHGQAGA